MRLLPLIAILAGAAHGAPVIDPYPVEGPDDTVAIAASALTGAFAAADSFEDSIEIRDVNATITRTISRTDIEALAPWLDLGGNQDGPTALAWSDSGRLLFILVFDATIPGDAQPSDAILRYDAFADALTLFHRLDLSDNETAWPHAAMAHHEGRLHVGLQDGSVLTLRAQRNDTTATVLSTVTVAPATPVTGLAIDRFEGLLYAAAGPTIYRAGAASTPAFATVGSLATDIRALAHSTHFGGAATAGLFALDETQSPQGSRVQRIPDDQARGIATFNPSAPYASDTDVWHDITSTSLGTLLIGADEDAVSLSDDTDTRLDLDDFIRDEFDQVVAFARGLISPDGEPPGWVIDADVIPAWSRFHPATPDGACWTVLLLLMDDHINGAPDAQALVRTILQRYAGTAPSGPAASRSPDGYFRHWIDPATGFTKSGWSTELATYSTMKIALAADRAAAFYPNDDDIQEAARAIICNVTDWDGYIEAGTDAVHLIASPSGGPLFNPRNFPFTEGILFVEQAAIHGGASSQASLARWLNRALWPSATYVTGRPVTSSSFGQFQPAFLSLYSFLCQKPFRTDPSWQAHIANILESHAAWTDDAAPRFFTVFSAGTTKGEWGGYNADSLSNHPGDVTTLTALMALAGQGNVNPAIAAYHAYRNGARQTFKTGASILYRRSAVDPAYDPNSAGLPDVAMGALGLAELIAPGSLDAVLAIDYDPDICAPPPPPCPGDIDGDGDTDVFDFNALANKWSQTVPVGEGPDLDPNGVIDVFDFNIFASDFGCTPPE